MPSGKPRRTTDENTRKRATEAKLPSTPDRRIIEDLMTAITGVTGGDDALERAQDLVYDAWGAKTVRQRIALAKKALAISPLCADAHVILAEHATPNSEQQLAFYQLGLQAGERALGEAAFEEDVGYFWGLIETRPYMRARFGLAQVLWTRGARDEAVAHYRELLRLNPDDNQGVRYVLAVCYLELDRDADLMSLMSDYEEDGSAAWLYTRVLVSFRREGDSALSREQFIEALDGNSHVPDYLLGKRRMPKALPLFMGMGDEDEAVLYMAEYGSEWARTPGALEWLDKSVAATRHSSVAQRD